MAFESPKPIVQCMNNGLMMFLSNRGLGLPSTATKKGDISVRALHMSSKWLYAGIACWVHADIANIMSNINSIAQDIAIETKT